MGKGRPRAVEKGVLGHCPGSSPSASLNIPQAPVYYPTEEEFNDPLEFIDKIRSEAESYGICRIVPPKSWKPPFALDLETFTFPTRSQEIHRLQARAAACDPETFELEYNRFLENHCGRKRKKRVIVFEGEELNLCKFFNAVKRCGGYDKVVKEKKWGDVFRFVCSVGKISECSKHVLCQLYREHLYDYEEYHNGLNRGKWVKKRKRVMRGDGKKVEEMVISDLKRRRNSDGESSKKGHLEEDEFDQICQQCKSGLHGEVMLLCDRCDKGWHLYCLSPPLEHVPLGNWYCLECVNSAEESFGFVQGKYFSLATFRRLADRAKRKWFGMTPASRSQIEKQFWEIVEGLAGEVEVMYGSDLDTSLYGSGFPRSDDPLPSSIDPDVWKKYSASPWNLNNLPKLQGSMLRTVHDNIAGVMVPWLYVGMLFSSFCWHYEDHCFYSMNYLHWGEPKCWYSVPGSEAHAFEQVMRNTLPDLFEAQPDLLFQLVTMLNPSVLQESGVSVYGVLQEPGNFVITFPRSFHGGFNFGFNCAEAVNFAPADWLPHGGFGAELYRLYHKPAVLSHEELLCVVAKGASDKKALPYLKEEMLRIFNKEKSCREKLWKNGTIKSSPMSPRKHPEYVGTEEDPTCIICQQHLYLSAVACGCRPSALVCLEHWEHLCECNPRKYCLRYRHTLAELNDLVLMLTPVSVVSWCLEEKPHSRACRPQFSCSNESIALMKKVKGVLKSHAQLAEDWLSSSRHIMSIPFSDDAYTSILRQAEQFLWAGHEMDLVRQMINNLKKAQKWAVDVRNCLSKVDTWLCHPDNNIEKVTLGYIQELLSFDPLPCNEPAHSKLKVQKLWFPLFAALLFLLLLRRKIADLEILFSRAENLPIYLEESRKLAREIDSAKVWINSVREYLSVKKPAQIEFDVLYKLHMEMGELCVQLPEMELLLDTLSQVKSWQVRCSDILEGPVTLKELDVLLQDADSFTVSIPELKLLRQYHCDTLSWICSFRDVISHIQEREDYSNVVKELTCILKAGKLLRVHVDELPIVETELRKSCCREKALKVLNIQMPLDFIEELITEAALLQIGNEKLFVDVSRVLAAAISWEERAKKVLRDMGQMSEFENVIRASEHLFVILPSLPDVKDALSMAKSWIRASQPFLMSTVSSGHSSRPSLKPNVLKDLVIQSTLLKVYLKAPEMLKSILNNVEAWERDACYLLEVADSLFNMTDIVISVDNGFTVRLEELLSSVKSVTEAGLALGFEFYEMQKLKNASLTLEWSLKALSTYSAPSFKKLLESSTKPLIQQIQHILKEGVAINIPSEDHFMQKLTEVKCISLQWVHHAKTVALDSGACELDEVFKLITEGENLPIHFEKELKLLRARSVLYCICRRPYDQRAMIACDQCDEWYHFDCINLREPPPGTYLCPACKPPTGESMSVSLSMHYEERSCTDGDPQTPPPRHSKSKRRRVIKARSSLQRKMLITTDLINILRCSSETDHLWRKSRRPFRRRARKHSKLENLFPLIC
ncbi:transcription factor jumonji (jmjC) domain-containing protein [Tasmannia lanceolata]|uniref:transcription factor jumonji (jmjC) domain-containing protein n=1 Tax=Tasmannia lanceolata TaxID=3420 RepID=UPI004064BE73